jgi:Ran-binding protein 1
MIPVTTDMKLQPNVGSDRSWVWKVAADFADTDPIAETLAIRFANSDSTCLVVIAGYDGIH